MRKIIVSTVVILALAFTTQAQDKKAKRSPEERAKVQSEKMKEGLKLSDAQQKQIEELKLKTAQAVKPYRQEQKEIQSKMRAVNKASEEEIKAVLSAEQIVQIDAIKAKSKENQKAYKVQQEELKRKLRELHTAEQEQLKSILSKKQYERYLEQRQNAKMEKKKGRS